MKFILALTFLPILASAETLSLQQYLESVKQNNPDARSALTTVEGLGGRQREGEQQFATNLYATLMMADNRAPQLIPAFQGDDTKSSEYKIGLRKQTDFGLGVDVSFDGQRTALSGLNQQLLTMPDGSRVNTDSFVGQALITVKQSFWSNGFGAAARADEKAMNAKNRSDLLQAQYRLKTILLNAENAYWAVVSYNEIIRLQQDNVDRAKKLQAYMNRQERQRLVDDTDAIQADADFETRALELQSSMDDRAVSIRDLNTLRGVDSDQVGELEAWPSENMMSQTVENPSGQMSREDFEQLRAQAIASRADGAGRRSRLMPNLDLAVTGATNGRNFYSASAISDVGTFHYPGWSVSLNFSMPLDFGLLSDIKQGYRKQEAAADQLEQEAAFSEKRVWDDLVKKKREAQGRFARAKRVESTQADLIKRERRRLLNGRATTFESISFEQNLAAAQINRVRAQLAVITLHNTLKTFEAK